MMNTMRHMLIAGAALAATGCISLLPETAPPKPRYQITSIDTASLEGGRLDWSLVVDDPRTTRVYDSVRVAVMPSAGKVEYFGEAEWADRAPRLFQIALIEAFEDSGRILAVGDRNAVPLADVVLQTDIRRMHYDVRNRDGAVDVSIYARLGDGKGRVYAAKVFQQTSPVNGRQADDVIAAFNAAFSELIPAMATWTYDQGEAAVGGA